MKKILLFIASLVTLYGCEHNNPDTERQLISISVKYLILKDDIRYATNTDIFYGLDDSCFIEYEGNVPIRVVGGVMNASSGAGLINLLFSEEVYDLIVHTGNVVNVTTDPKYYCYITDMPDNPVSYALSTDKKLLSVTKRNEHVFHYQYSSSLIIVTNSDGDIIQRMHFDNDNLVLIEEEAFDHRTGQLIGKKEKYFEDYDTNPNPLEGKFYIIGAFYRAFSKNNFTKYTIKSYISLDGITLDLIGSQTYSIPLTYDNLGYPLLGQYE
jgi:hypothetical protein